MRGLRAALALVAIVAVVLVASVSAAGELIGGQLSASPSSVRLLSQSTIPVAVTMTAEGNFKVAPDSYTLEPGGSKDMDITGEPVGRVLARLAAVTPPEGGDASALVLSVSLQPSVAPAPPFGLIALAGLAGLGIVLALYRLRRRYARRRQAES